MTNKTRKAEGNGTIGYVGYGLGVVRYGLGVVRYGLGVVRYES